MGEMMPVTTSDQSDAIAPTEQRVSAQAALSPALVHAVAEKVYQLWLAELKLSRERTGLRIQVPHH